MPTIVRSERLLTICSGSGSPAPPLSSLETLGRAIAGVRAKKCDVLPEYVGDVVREYVGDVVREYVGDVVREYVGDVVREYVGDVVREYVGDVVREYVGFRVRMGSRSDSTRPVLARRARRRA